MPASIHKRHADDSLLLIEDNAADAKLVRETLTDKRFGTFSIEWAKNLSDGLERLSKGGIDAVLADLLLPDSQGIETVDRLLWAAPHVPILVISGIADDDIGTLAIQHGAQDYVPKGHLDSYTISRALRNMIDRRKAEDILFAEKDRAEVTLNSIGDAVLCTDKSGCVTYLNTVAEKMTGWLRREAWGRPLTNVFQIIDGITRQPARNPVEIAITLDETVGLTPNCILIRHDGHELAIEDSAAPIHDRDGNTTGAVIVFHDVSAARSMSLQLAHSASHDILTGLPNRMLLSDRVSQAIALALRYKRKVAVLFIDLDGFKHINDSLGHSIGDKLLKSVGARLAQCVRASDTVSRQGGDEFVVLLSGVEHSTDVANTINRMLQALGEAHSVDKHDLHVTASIGVSIYPEDGPDAETLIKNADTAMYQAKDNGRHCHRFFKVGMNVVAVERQSIEESLRRALERHEFAIHYQPIINLKTGHITGAEALIRWTHPSRGVVPPAQFIPVAEDCGLILPIGNWILLEACKQARAWMDAGLTLTKIAVNLSAMQFRNEHFPESVLMILDQTGLDPKALELELTESVLMRRPESAASTLASLRARGIQIAIDDFGTGYSSLSYLKNFPVDALKIDQSFLRQITPDSGDATIVRAIISMGRSLNLRVVAEGVETEEELAFLRAHDCDEAQGFYFSRPVPAPDFAKLLETGISDSVYLALTASAAAPSIAADYRSLSRLTPL